MSQWFPKRTLGMLPAEAARKWPHRESLVFRDQRWTHGQFNDEVDRVARALMANGVNRGDHVAIWITNRPEFLFLFYAIIKIGAVVIPLNTRYRVLDLAYALVHSECTTVVTIERGGPIEFGAMVEQALGVIEPLPNGRVRSAKCPDIERVIFVDGEPMSGALSWSRFLAGADRVSAEELSIRAAQVDPDGVALIMYTSGTTGNPKGVMLGHILVRMCTERAAQFGMTQADISLNYLPLFHMFSLGYIALHCILTGASQVLMETFDAEEALNVIKAERATMLHGFDTHFNDMINAKKRMSGVDVSSLRVGCFAGGLENTVPIAIETQKELCPTLSGWGMTETGSGQTSSFLDDDLDKRCRASGFPMPGVEIRIVDPDTGLDVPQGTQGEILQRSYCCMIGYFKDPDATAATIDKDGWLHTGDAGLLRPDGHLRVLGRYKDMLKVGGENVSPAEVETLLLQVPEIAQVAVVGSPDPRLNEVAVAFAVLKSGATIEPERVIEFCRGKLASYKIPRRVIFTDSLPMTPSGKIQKHKLREQLK